MEGATDGKRVKSGILLEEAFCVSVVLVVVVVGAVVGGGVWGCRVVVVVVVGVVVALCTCESLWLSAFAVSEEDDPDDDDDDEEPDVNTTVKPTMPARMSAKTNKPKQVRRRYIRR